MANIIAELTLEKSLNVISGAKVFSGENLTTSLIISIPPVYSDYQFYIEFHCSNDRILSTPKLELESNSITYPLSYELLKGEGRVDFQVVARLNLEETLVFKSNRARFIIETSINAVSVLEEEYHDVLVSCEKAAKDATEAAILSNSASDRAIAVIDTANSAIENINEAYNSASYIITQGSNIIGTIENKLNECSIAIEGAEQAALLANNAALSSYSAAENAENAANQADSAKDSIEELYSDIQSDYVSGAFHGKDAYQFAKEAGYSGSIEEFYHLLGTISENEGIKGYFVGYSPRLRYCTNEGKIEGLKIYSERSVTMPEDYILDYVLPEDSTLTLTVSRSLESSPDDTINISLPQALYATAVSSDEIRWDNSLNRYVAVYRNACIDLSEFNWVALLAAYPNNDYMCYRVTDFHVDADILNPYFECGSMPYRFDTELINNDMPGISLYISGGSLKVCDMRISRELLSDYTAINEFLLNHRHKIIVKLSNEVIIPLSESDSSKLAAIKLYYPDTYLKAYSQDKEYVLLGGYSYDFYHSLELKASLNADNYFVGTQRIEGDVLVNGNIYVKEDNPLPLAARETAPNDKSLMYWDSELSGMATNSEIRIDNFLKKEISSVIAIEPQDWTVSGVKREAVIENNKIKSDSLVLVNYENESKEAATASGINKYNPIVNEGSLTLIADDVPEQELLVKLIIIGA